MTEETAPPATGQNPKVVMNVIVAAILTLLGIWMAVADFSHHGDLLFQGSLSILLTVLFVALLFMVLIVVAALPKRVIIGANLLVLSRCGLGFPLNVWLGNTDAARVVTVTFLLLSLGYFSASLARMHRISARPWLQARHSIIAGAAWLLVGVISLPFFFAGYAYAAKNLMGDYLEISPSRMSLVERVFEKNGQQVHLIGMMHIGDGRYYRELQDRLTAPPAAGGKRLILTEGVSDKDQILPATFAHGKAYERWAKMLGLESQKPLDGGKAPSAGSGTLAPEPGSTGDPNITWQNADIDISELQQKHRTLLVGMLTALGSDNIAEILTSKGAQMTGEEAEDLLMNGLLLSRNEVLISRFKEMAPAYNEVYIPWGAAHLPDIEKRLTAMGYRKSEEETRPIVTFWK